MKLVICILGGSLVASTFCIYSKIENYKRVKFIKNTLTQYGISNRIIDEYKLVEKIDSRRNPADKVCEDKTLSCLANFLSDEFRSKYNSTLNTMRNKHPKIVKDFNFINDMKQSILLEEIFIFNKDMQISIEVNDTAFKLLELVNFNFRLFRNTEEIEYGLNILNSVNSFMNYLLCIADISNKVSPSEFINKLNYKVEACKTLKENI